MPMFPPLNEPKFAIMLSPLPPGPPTLSSRHMLPHMMATLKVSHYLFQLPFNFQLQALQWLTIQKQFATREPSSLSTASPSVTSMVASWMTPRSCLTLSTVGCGLPRKLSAVFKKQCQITDTPQQYQSHAHHRGVEHHQQVPHQLLPLPRCPPPRHRAPPPKCSATC
jgi:hypothetical protein